MKRSALIVTIVPLVAIAFLLVNFVHPPWTLARLFGLVLVLAAGVALTVSRVELGDSFSLGPEAHELVTRGIYSRISNPIYVFGAILIAGLLLFLNQPKWLFILLIIIPVQIVRARAEGRVLEERFGDAYRRYKDQTWF
jgi:protein-S-isoprenylcysteine O-methyltransferase Ste14